MRPRALLVAVSLCLVSASLFAADISNTPRRDSVVRISPAAFQAAIDPATGQLRQITPAEARALARTFMASLHLKPNAEPRTLSNGMTGVTLDDSYLNFYMGRVTPEGTVEFSCVNTPADAVNVLVTPAPSSIVRLPQTGAPLSLEEK